MIVLVLLHVRGYTALDNAVQFNHLAVVKLLREVGAQLRVSPVRLASELCNAAAKNDVDSLKSFALAGANMGQEGKIIFNGGQQIGSCTEGKSA